jgi:ADP-ribosylglycohydrolase
VPCARCPIGWATPLTDGARRRRLVADLTRTTHPDPDAVCAAAVLAACASWSVEGASPALLLQVAIDEQAAAATEYGAGPQLARSLAQLAKRRWRPPDTGISLDPTETVTAALACTLHTSTLREALLHAVGMGGDTDTVAALVGGLLGAGMTSSDLPAHLPWYTAVRLPDPQLVGTTASALALARAAKTSPDSSPR